MSSLISVTVIAVSLALDALAVSIAGGVRAGSARWADALKVGLFLGGFQAGMPLLGYLVGNAFKDVVSTTVAQPPASGRRRCPVSRPRPAPGARRGEPIRGRFLRERWPVTECWVGGSAQSV